MNDEDTENEISRSKPKWGNISLLSTIIGNIAAYALMSASNGGPSDISGAMIGALIGLGTIAITPVTALISLAAGERPVYYALGSIMLEATLIILFFHYHG